MDAHVLDLVRALAQSIANEPCIGAQVPRLFFVGGTVRDMYLHEEVRDCDLEVYGVVPERVKSIVEAVFGVPVYEVGALFGIFSVYVGEYRIDIALPRVETKVAPGHQGFSITGDPHLAFAPALRRRDFTVNAMLRDVLTEEVIDPFRGREDLEKGILRIVDAHMFPEDPLRVYRAMQFLARFNWTCEEQTLHVMQRMVASGEVCTLPPERVTQEWKKMLSGAYPQKGWEFLATSGLCVEYPEIVKQFFTSRHVHDIHEGTAWDAVYDAWIMTCTYPWKSDLVLLRLALMFASDKDAQAFFARHAFSSQDEDRVVRVLKHAHHIPEIFLSARQEEWTHEKQANALRMLLREVGDDAVEVLFDVCEVRARVRGEAYDESYPVRAWYDALDQKYDVRKSAQEKLLSGKDILALCALHAIPVPQGHAFGRIIQDVELLRDAGKITTKAQAKEAALSLCTIKSPPHVSLDTQK